MCCSNSDLIILKFLRLISCLEKLSDPHFKYIFKNICRKTGNKTKIITSNIFSFALLGVLSLSLTALHVDAVYLSFPVFHIVFTFPDCIITSKFQVT